MRKFLRLRFWLTRLALLTGAALLLGGASGADAEDALAAPEPGIGASALAPGTGPSLEDARLARLLGVPIRTAEPEAAEVVAGDPDDPVRTALSLRLLGTLVDSSGEFSLAAVEDEDLRAATYRVGDEIRGARIVGIQRDHVTILAGGRYEFFDTVIVTYANPRAAIRRSAER